MTHANQQAVEKETPLQKSVAAVLKNEHTWNQASIKRINSKIAPPFKSTSCNHHLLESCVRNVVDADDPIWSLRTSRNIVDILVL
jgi:hypothetical protein